MEKAGEPGTAVFDDQKLLILTVNVSSATGKPEAAGDRAQGTGCPVACFSENHLERLSPKKSFCTPDLTRRAERN